MSEQIDFDELREQAQDIVDKLERFPDVYRNVTYRGAWFRFAYSVYVNRERKLQKNLYAFYEEYKAMMERGASLKEIDKFIRLCFEPVDDEEDIRESLSRWIDRATWNEN